MVGSPVTNFWHVFDIDRSRSYSFEYKEQVDFIRFEAQTTLYLKYGRGNLLDFAALVAVVNGMNANAWIGLMIGITCHLQ